MRSKPSFKSALCYYVFSFAVLLSWSPNWNRDLAKVLIASDLLRSICFLASDQICSPFLMSSVSLTLIWWTSLFRFLLSYYFSLSWDNKGSTLVWRFLISYCCCVRVSCAVAILLTSSVILTWCLWGPVVEKGRRRTLLNMW